MPNITQKLVSSFAGIPLFEPACIAPLDSIGAVSASAGLVQMPGAGFAIIPTFE